MENSFVVQFINKHFPEEDRKHMDFFFASNILSSDVKDAYGKPIFPESNVRGSLLFIDPMNIANWSHACEYWLLSEDGVYLFSNVGEWPPHEDLRVSKIFI